jgi:hypothetical protein
MARTHQPGTERRRTEQTAIGLATYHEPTYRTYAPEWVAAGPEQEVLLQLGEELVAGRWEPFCATRATRPRGGPGGGLRIVA